MLATNGLGLVVQAIVLSWILKIEKKCECSKDWRRDYIKYMSIISIALTPLMMLAGPKVLAGLGTKVLGPAVVIIALAGIVNLAAVLTYIPNLKKRDCTCAIENEWRDNFIWWWMLVGTILMFIVPLVVVTKKLTH